jgi:hypothetical protein
MPAGPGASRPDLEPRPATPAREKDAQRDSVVEPSASHHACVHRAHDPPSSCSSRPVGAHEEARFFGPDASFASHKCRRPSTFCGARDCTRSASTSTPRPTMRSPFDSARLFFCALCRTQVRICGSCDRGQRYCSPDCRSSARRRNVREARRRYAQSERGRARHATRQRRYRVRVAAGAAPEQTRPTAPAPSVSRTARPETRTACAFCNGPCSVFLRLSFLSVIRHGRRATTRDRRRSNQARKNQAPAGPKKRAFR